MSDWRLATALRVLQREVNAAHPDRPKSADGTIGDARHQAERSDHNPTAPHAGVVTAWDITTAPFTIDLAEKLRLMGKRGDARPKYLIYRGQITSAEHGWEWAAYSGYSQHFDHIHLSVSNDPRFYDSSAPWGVYPPDPAPEDEMTDSDLKKIDAMIKAHVDAAVKQLHDENVLILHGNAADGHVNSIDSIAKKVGVPQP